MDESVDEDSDTVVGRITQSLPSTSLSREDLSLLVGCILFVVAMRVLLVGAVFRDGAIVLAGNDPYAYLMSVENHLRVNSGIFLLPKSASNGNLGFVVVVVLLSELFGGASAVGDVLAWYPVVAGALIAVAVYAIAVTATGDRRVGFASMLCLAVTPVATYRTMVGFGDHHAFNYLLLAVTVLAIVRVGYNNDPVRTRPFATMIAIGTLGIVFVLQIVSWTGSPLFLPPVALAVFVTSIAVVEKGQSPVRTVGPLVAGVGVASGIVVILSAGVGALDRIRAVALGFTFVGIVAVVGMSEVGHRRQLPIRHLIAGEIALIALVGIVTWAIIPLGRWLAGGFGYLVTNRAIVETGTLFRSETGFFMYPILEFGLFLFIAVPYLCIITWGAYRRKSVSWLVIVSYTWWFLLLSLLESRFTGQLSLFVAIFSGIGVVQMADKIELIEGAVTYREGVTEQVRSVVSFPSRRYTVLLVALFLLVGGLGGVVSPLRMNQLAVDDTTYETARWIEDTAADSSQPYVFSRWDKNRVYNYFANGELQSYRYSKRWYKRFLGATASDQWYERLESSGKADLIVIEQRDGDTLSESSLYSRLYRHHGSKTSGTSALSHFRVVHVSEDRSVKVFEPVPGATIEETISANETVRITTNQSVSGTEFTYERVAQTGTDGTYEVTVPYVGTYTVHGSETTQVEISEGAVRRR